MKKLFAMAMAVAAISFASCGNKTEKAECCDSTACECKCDTCTCDPCQCAEAKCCGECPLKDLAEKLEAGDAEAVTGALAKAEEKIQELLAEGKTEEAGKVASAVKEFIDTNKEKLAEAQVSTENIVSTITNLPATVAETAEAGVEAVKEDAAAAVDAAKEKAEEKAAEAVDAAKEKAAEKVDEAATKAADKVKGKLGL